MVENIGCYIISAFFLLVVRGILRAWKAEKKKFEDYKRRKAVVVKTYHDDGEYPCYHVGFTDNGRDYIADTGAYCTYGEVGLQVGDEVEIGYNSVDDAVVEIFDERVAPLSRDGKILRIFFIVGVAFFGIGTFYAIRALFL